MAFPNSGNIFQVYGGVSDFVVILQAEKAAGSSANKLVGLTAFGTYKSILYKRLRKQ